MLTGMCVDSESACAIVRECSATCSSVSGPYRCWLPVTNHISNCLRSIMVSTFLLYQSVDIMGHAEYIYSLAWYFPFCLFFVFSLRPAGRSEKTKNKKKIKYRCEE